MSRGLRASRRTHLATHGLGRARAMDAQGVDGRAQAVVGAPLAPLQPAAPRGKPRFLQ
jgi:hypothetical protein